MVGLVDSRDINTGAFFWKNGAPDTAPPTDPTEYDNAAAVLAGYEYGYIDLEHWPHSKIWFPSATDGEMWQAWKDLETIWEAIKSRAPSVKLGYYGTIGAPASSWPIDGSFSIQYAEAWEKVWGANETGLPNMVDYLAQDFYWSGQPVSVMKRRLQNEVAISRGYTDKPIYPFLWHRRLDVFDGGDTSDASLVPMVEWQELIDMCLQYADGFTFWQHPFETITPAAQLRLDAIQTAANSL